MDVSTATGINLQLYAEQWPAGGPRDTEGCSPDVTSGSLASATIFELPTGMTQETQQPFRAQQNLKGHE
jgi:hypothetical protein